MAEGEIKIVARVDTKKAQADLKRAAGPQGGLATDAGAFMAAEIAKEISARNKETMRMLKEQAAARKKHTDALIAGIVQDKNKMWSGLSSLSMPAMGQISPVTAWFAAKGAFDSLSGTKEGGALMSRVGLTGPAGAAAGALGLTAVAIAVGTALNTLRKAIEDASQEFIRARGIYASATLNGMGTRYTAQTSVLGDVMGVAPEDVFKMGAAVGYLNEKTALAVRLLEANNRVLTDSSWKTGILKADWLALMSNLASAFAPLKNRVTDFIDSVIKKGAELTKPIEEKPISLKNDSWFGNLGAIPSSSMGYMSARGLGYNNPSPVNIPQVPSTIDRMPASPWEKMGLVIGAGGRQQYDKQTAENTKRLVDLFQENLDQHFDFSSKTEGTVHNIP